MSLAQNKNWIGSVRALLIDLDGVVYRGEAPLPGAADVVATRANGDPARRCDRVVDRGSLVALVERLRDAEREAHLVETGGEQPVVPALVQREPGADDAVRSAEGRDYLLGACHLRDAPRVDEARHLDRP